MKIKFSKSARIADTEIVVLCETSVSSPLAAMQIHELVKEGITELARDVRDKLTKIKAYEDVREKAAPVMRSLGEDLINEPTMRKRK